MPIYTVCLGITIAVEAKSEEEAIERAEAELQYEPKDGVAGQGRGALEFDVYDVSKVNVKDGVITFEQSKDLALKIIICRTPVHYYHMGGIATANNVVKRRRELRPKG